MTFLRIRSSKVTEEELPPYHHTVADQHPHAEAAPEYSKEEHENRPSEKVSEKYDIPVVDVEPIDINVISLQRHFMTYNENWLSELLTFVSQDAREKYKSFKGSEGQSFDHALELQRQGYGMPLLRTDHHSLGALYSTRYMSFYKFVPPPVSENRLFDRKIDKFKFCEATKERCASYYKYELKFTPDPHNPKKNFSLYMIDHHRYPIVDLSPYNGQRLRWVSDNNWSGSKWYYSLNTLQEYQPSLTDDLRSDGRVNKNNPLLGNAWKNNLLPLMKSRSEYTGIEVGVAHDIPNYFHSINLLPALGFSFRDNLKDESEKERAESINSVGQDSLVFLCMTSIFKRIQDIKEQARRASN